MSRRRQNRVEVHLDDKGIDPLSDEDIRIILRGADEFIATAGRNMLCKILKGSRERKLLELGLDACPIYGHFTHLPMAEVQAMVDWTILNGYLRIDYNWRMPTLVYTAVGWEIERETFAKELLGEFDAMIEAQQDADQPHFDMLYLKDRARDMIMLLLDLVEESGDAKYIPLLQAWKQVDYKKVQQRINQVIRTIEA